MSEPRWPTRDLVVALHDEQLALFGGGDGVRDEGLLESALARPLNRFHYEPDAPLFDLAAAYCAGIVCNHPFIDGNKRTGLLAAVVFLHRNGYRLNPDQRNEVAVILALASGQMEDAELAAWLKANSTPR
ncbi:MAG: type II toxin-antitoxin system death-on-curing family toxin [Rhodospirillales bacterium CG15_BIG_FIL_POST_REV_8_21_14_020_66_15]|nr:MAG: type II toxin-antitoxin system death-on-curing family toxin [Rhodospirillales bacterium CG15_BIG_FIL_POST_REV_8_21_14_020_66_15]